MPMPDAIYPYSIVYKYLSCFHYFLRNNTTVNAQVHVFVWTFPRHVCLGVGLLGHVVTMFNHLRNCQTGFQSVCPILHSHQLCMTVQFPHILLNTCS